MPLDNFKQALIELGPNDNERAKRLGISRRAFMEYKAGRVPDMLFRLMHPALLRALANDAEKQQETAQNHKIAS